MSVRPAAKFYADHPPRPGDIGEWLCQGALSAMFSVDELLGEGQPVPELRGRVRFALSRQKVDEQGAGFHSTQVVHWHRKYPLGLGRKIKYCRGGWPLASCRLSPSGNPLD